jgi:glycerate 2-kinase
MEKKKEAENIFLAGVESVLPDILVRTQVKLSDDVLYFTDECRIPLAGFNRIYVLGAGKASALMAKEVENILGGKITKGHVIVKYGSNCELNRISVTEAGHPFPDRKGVGATDEILKIASQALENDLVICLFSGGASALLADYPAGSTLEDLILMNQLLVKSGADIREINTVRKHLSRVKGGQLAKALYPATVVSLILSDVVGDAVDVIASGPTCADGSTFNDALLVLDKYHLLDVIPTSMYAYLQNGLLELIPETPKVGDFVFDHVSNLIIGSNRIALEAAAQKSLEYGYSPFILTAELSGDLSDVADFVLSSAYRIKNDAKIKKPVCLLAGGEPTIHVTEKGLGGRNQHFALYCATKISEMDGLTVLCAGTDGTDGSTDVAGAVVDCDTVENALKISVDPQTYLNEQDSFHFFYQNGGQVITGSTLTNVMDLVVVLID